MAMYPYLMSCIRHSRHCKGSMCVFYLYYRHLLILLYRPYFNALLKQTSRSFSVPFNPQPKTASLFLGSLCATVQTHQTCVEQQVHHYQSNSNNFCVWPCLTAAGYMQLWKSDSLFCCFKFSFVFTVSQRTNFQTTLVCATASELITFNLSDWLGVNWQANRSKWHDPH